MFTKKLFANVSTASLSLLCSLHGADLSADYTWNQMKIGGGGWVVGMDISPTRKDLMFIRADVSGAYRWEPSTSTWKQVVTAASMPAEDVGYGKYSGVDSIVSSPKDPDTVYMAFNPHGYDKGSGHIYKSADRGDHWTNTAFAACNVAMEPNGKGRQEGERLAIDPNNSDVVYFGSINDGLWKTTDGGATWAKVTAILAGTPKHGVNTVVFDKGGGTIGQEKGRGTKVIYVTVDGGDVFRSGDAGATWVNIGQSGPGSVGKVRDAEVGPDRTYFVCFENDPKDPAVKGSCWKYSAEGKWTDITPPPDAQGKNGGSQFYSDLAVDPTDGKHIVLIRGGGKFYNSTDQGSTWSFHLFHLNSDIRWQGSQDNHHLSVGELLFDPFVPGKLWFAEGFGVWYATDLTTENIEWQSASHGIEEMCGNDVIAPPGGQPIAIGWDLGAFYFSNPDTYTAQRSQPHFMACWGIDWCAHDPKFIAAVLQNNLGFPPHPKSAGYSTDGGQTWTRFAAVDSEKLPADLQFGVIAVSAQSAEHIVWCPANGKLPYYTTDKGATWTQSKFPPEMTKTALVGYPQDIRPLCADRVHPDTFYLYAPKEGFFRSTDGGANFTRLGSTPASNGWSGILKATPDHGGDLWLTPGRNATGFFHSTDGGSTWTKVEGLKQVYNFGFGKAEADGGFPTLFAAGKTESGESEIFRSTDQGAKWDRICAYPLGIDDLIKGIDGDKNHFGVVYLGFNGSGFAYGKPNGTPTPTAGLTSP